MKPLEVEKLYAEAPHELYVILALFEEMVKEGEIDLLQYLLWLEDIYYVKYSKNRKKH